MKEQGAGELLGDRARPLRPLSPEDPRQVVPEGPEDPPVINARMAVEAVVFRGDDRLDQDVGDFGEGNFDAVLLGELLNGLAVGRVDGRDELGLHRLELGDRGEVVFDGHEGPEEPSQDGGRPGEKEDKEDADDVAPPGFPDLNLEEGDGHGLGKQS